MADSSTPSVPILPIAATVALITVLSSLLLHRRTAPHACPHCNYDLRGIPRGRCPECGIASIIAQIARRLLARASTAWVRPG